MSDIMLVPLLHTHTATHAHHVDTVVKTGMIIKATAAIYQYITCSTSILSILAMG